MIRQDTPYLEVPTIPIKIKKEVREDGNILIWSDIDLEEYPEKATDRLKYWAGAEPQRTFIAQRDHNGAWRSFGYGEVYKKIQHIGQYLLDNAAYHDGPVVVLSGNSWQHALLALAAMHVGVPYSAISPAYSLKSKDFKRLVHCIGLLNPGLVFVQDGRLYEKALGALPVPAPVVVAENPLNGAISFDELMEAEPTDAVSGAHARIHRDTVAKILFTSGSTGWPKGVINTHGNLMCNLQQITQTYPFVANGGLTLVDWLPWSHTFGGNHNFGLTYYNGGTFYIDEGNPTVEGFATTVENLKDIAPTVYFNVPKGFEELVVHLKNDEALCRTFFSRLKMLFFGGASLSQHVRDDLDRLALRTVGYRILISSGYGMTEACPSTMFNTRYDQRSGNLGVPVPGIVSKLVAFGDDSYEVRFKGPNLTPGYWKDDEQTANAFDDQGFFKSGDALKFADENDPGAGMVYDGRITENFKLNSGTWVNVGILKSKLIAAGNGLIKDAVLTGHDRDFVGAILFLELSNCASFAKMPGADFKTIIRSEKIIRAIENIVQDLSETGTGASTVIRRATIADFNPSVKKGELTDKGSINQRAVLTYRKKVVESLYKVDKPPTVIEISIGR
ncbi:feruloyl-CoA synthase [Pseudozobellia thermophila]|uniref:Feruloyl-CoA synthase n=1 Tax=Pseudozobellia thermophila TaxID=192903 RepID=A0A1M6CFR3_9FLAO|nr:feruloyl-CoA synthase [Pseudozobellia thermophila]SHI59880.1 feruloyl-CoA synthase [Pseudozobellia thermophila]